MVKFFFIIFSAAWLNMAFYFPAQAAEEKSIFLQAKQESFFAEESLAFIVFTRFSSQQHQWVMLLHQKLENTTRWIFYLLVSFGISWIGISIAAAWSGNYSWFHVLGWCIAVMVLSICLQPHRFEALFYRPLRLLFLAIPEWASQQWQEEITPRYALRNSFALITNIQTQILNFLESSARISEGEGLNHASSMIRAVIWLQFLLLFFSTGSLSALSLIFHLLMAILPLLMPLGCFVNGRRILFHALGIIIGCYIAGAALVTAMHSTLWLMQIIIPDIEMMWTQPLPLGIPINLLIQIAVISFLACIFYPIAWWVSMRIGIAFSYSQVTPFTITVRNS
jgi:hypothetical protein